MLILKRVQYFILFICSIVIFENCAKMGGITGGEKDIKPPKLVSSTPLNYSTNFNGKRIDITFDEFVLLNNVNQALVISPPLEGKPEVRLRGKSLQINLEGDLRENTTYTLNFGNSIEDNNERNVLENFEFVFSTGDFLDSLSIDGTILNSFTLKPSEEPFIIMAYDILEDSVPLKEVPVYIGRSDKTGYFRINNMKEDTFKIFAIKDLNYNYLFDLPNELIAFPDTFIYLFPDSLEKWEPPIVSLDTTLNDIKKTGVASDSLWEGGPKGKHTWFKPYRINFLYFEEDRRIQYLTDYERKEDRHLLFTFNLPLDDTLDIRGLNFTKENWFVSELNISRDTFNLWINDSLIYNNDTISLLLSYPGVDSMGNFALKEDTLNLIHRQEREVKGREEKAPVTSFNMRTIANKGQLDLNTRIRLSEEYPIPDTDLSKIFLYNIPDSVEIPVKFNFFKDSLSARSYYIEGNWKSKDKYRMFIEPGAFKDIYGRANDTLNVLFSIQDEEYYGVLYVSTSNVHSPVIVQLMNDKEILLKEQFSEKDEKLSFSFLKPGRYIIKYIFDRNNNHKWDTGNYLANLQPERVEYYKGEINIRSNWELEIKWELSEPEQD